jgi:hypothetical protein
LKLLQRNIGNILEDTGIDNNFLNRTPISQEIRARFDKWDSIKKLLHIKGSSYQNAKTVYRMRENLCQLLIRQDV